MYRMVYLSAAVTKFSQAELIGLLNVARVNNAALGVTGLLLYKDGDFMQLLEGERQVVRQLYRKIQGDRRHQGCDILLNGDVEERMFDDWTMGFRDLGDPSTRSVPGFSTFMNRPLSDRSYRQNPAECIELLEVFRRSR